MLPSRYRAYFLLSFTEKTIAHKMGNEGSVRDGFFLCEDLELSDV